MDEKKFTENKQGKLISTDLPDYKYAFLPDPLPPAWEWSNELWPLLNEASSELARLDGVGQHIQAPDLLLLKPLQRREALRSSSLEGTYVSAQELLLFEMEPRIPSSETDPVNAWREVNNYSEALWQFERLRDELPFSRRMFCELHEILMSGVRGANKKPGEIRKGSVQIGRPARFIPPTANYVPDCIGELETYIHGKREHDPLVDAFIVHYQFETIHPFLDGNGRVGRLVLSLLIYEWCKLNKPWLYMSEYFENNKDEYIDSLFNVSASGNWKSWIEFCLKGVIVQSREAITRCGAIVKLKKEFFDIVHSIGGNTRLLKIADDLFDNPIVRVPNLAERHDVTWPTSRADVEKLESVGILRLLPETFPAAYYSPKIYQTLYIE